jgi:hypothetical protein
MSVIEAIKVIPESFYARSLYRKAAHEWANKPFVYLLILLALCSIPITVICIQGLGIANVYMSEKMIPQLHCR